MIHLSESLPASDHLTDLGVDAVRRVNHHLVAAQEGRAISLIGGGHPSGAQLGAAHHLLRELRLLPLMLVLLQFVDENLLPEELAVALEVAGVLPELIESHFLAAFAANAPHTGTLVVDEVVLNRVFIQVFLAPVGAQFAQNLAVVPHVVDVVMVLIDRLVGLFLRLTQLPLYDPVAPHARVHVLYLGVL